MEKDVSKNLIIGIAGVLVVVLLINAYGNNLTGADVIRETGVQYGNCNLNEDCYLKYGDITKLDGKLITLGLVGSKGQVRVKVADEETGRYEIKIIALHNTVTIKGLKITNKKAYYDLKDYKNSDATLVITKETSGTSSGGGGSGTSSQPSKSECNENKCNLYEGDKVITTIDGERYTFSTYPMVTRNIVISVYKTSDCINTGSTVACGGEISLSLGKGQSYTFENYPIKITIKDLGYSSETGVVSWVTFEYEKSISEPTSGEVKVTYKGVLEMLSKCDVVNVGIPAQGAQTGNSVCSIFGKKCVYNFIGFDPQVTVSGSTNKISQPISCDDATNNYPTASWGRVVCCLTP